MARDGRSSMNAILEVRNLVKQFPKVLAVDHVSFAVDHGSCLGLLGPNGAGKTTTIEMMEGISPASEGEILYKGQPHSSRFAEEIGIQFQSTALQDFLTVRETLELFQKLYQRHSNLDTLIEACALGDLLGRDNRKLSGGQRQRLLLAVALVNDPEVVFLDEPTTGLDPQARRNFWRLVESIKARDKTVILTTHYMEEAYHLCDKVLIMDHGRIIAEGTPHELLAAHFDDVILALPQTHVDDRLENFPFAVLPTETGIEISTKDVDGTIRALLERNISLRGLSIRPRTLEDLFLELTGRELRG